MSRTYINRPVSFHSIRDKAKEAFDSQMKTLSLREQDRRRMITRLDEESLREMLQEFRAKYYNKESNGITRLTFDARVDSIMQSKLKDKYPQLPPEEIQMCKEFIKNFVFVGDQFLYVRVE